MLGLQIFTPERQLIRITLIKVSHLIYATLFLLACQSAPVAARIPYNGTAEILNNTAVSVNGTIYRVLWRAWEGHVIFTY